MYLVQLRMFLKNEINSRSRYDDRYVHLQRSLYADNKQDNKWRFTFYNNDLGT